MASAPSKNTQSKTENQLESKKKLSKTTPSIEQRPLTHGQSPDKQNMGSAITGKGKKGKVLPTQQNRGYKRKIIEEEEEEEEQEQAEDKEKEDNEEEDEEEDSDKEEEDSDASLDETDPDKEDAIDEESVAEESKDEEASVTPLYDKVLLELPNNVCRKRRRPRKYVPDVKMPKGKKRKTERRTESNPLLLPQPLVRTDDVFPIVTNNFTVSDVSYEAMLKNELRIEGGKQGLHQQDDTAAEKWINDLMQRPPTENELEKRLTLFETEENGTNFIQWWNKSDSIVNMEKALAIHDNDLDLKFIPKSTKPNKHGQLKGNYEICVHYSDKTSKVVKVANDWVENNFSKDFLSVVQRAAMEAREKIVDKDSNRSLTGFISLRNEMGNHVWENRQISRIRFVPSKKVKEGLSEVDREAFWQGAIIIPETTSYKMVKLTQKWMNENISKEFQKLLREMRTNEKKYFIPIPEGDNDRHMDGVIVYERDAPYAKYYKPLEEQGERRCVSDSAASALHYLGFTNLSRILSSTKTDRTKDICGIIFFRDVIQKYCNK